MRDNKTAIEPFLSGIWDWEAGSLVMLRQTSSIIDVDVGMS
jgi:hypothetical protein